MMCLESQAQVSYWFSQWQKKGNAQDAQEFFMWPGTNISFSYASNHVIINSTGGGGGGNLQLFGDVTSPLTALPNVTATLATLGGGGVNTKITFNTKGLVTGSSAATLASADFQNQGTLTTLLHGNSGGNPSWSAVDLANDVTGNLGVTHLNSGTDADNLHYWRGDGTWATVTGPTILDIRTNAFNYFLGTNSFTNDVYIAWNQAYLGAPSFLYGGAKWGLGCTNVQSTAFLPYAGVIRGLPSGSLTDAGGRYLCFGISENFATGWFDDAFVPNFFYGAGFSARSENDGVEKGVFLAGSPVCIGGRTTASTPVYFMQSGRPAAGMTSTGNLFSGRNWSPGQLFGTSAGGIFATNFMHTLHYSRAMRGFVVNSNAWATLAWSTPPNFQIAGSGDSFSYGDMWMLSSNGVPTFVWKDIAGTVHTNQVGVQTVGLTITQNVMDFVLGAITNVYSNGLLVATGEYVVPMIAAAGDVILGAFGETLEPADTL